MFLKLLFLLIILYFVVRTMRSLIHAVRSDSPGVPPSVLNREPPRPAGWQGSNDSTRRVDENVEDAKWVDL